MQIAPFFRLNRVLSLTCGCLLLAGCGSSGAADGSSPGISVSRARLTDAQKSVLGFETLDGWNLSQGQKALTSTHSEGQQAFSLSVGGWSELESVALSSLGKAPETVSVDIELPKKQANVWWYGAVQLYVSLPSRGLYNRYVGQNELTGKSLDQFLTLSFPVPADIQQALSTTYSDLKLKFAINVPTGNGPYLIDHVNVGQGSPPPVDPNAPCNPFFSVGLSGDVRYELTTTSADSAVQLRVRKNGGSYLDQLLPAPSDVLANGNRVYSLVDSAKNYQAGDTLAVQFSFTRQGQSCDASRDWAPDLAFVPGDRVRYQGQIYECRQAHRAQLGWEPAQNLALWQIPNACVVADWAANTAYALGDRVAFAGKTYETLQAHTSQSDWTPLAAPALWRMVEGASSHSATTATLYEPGPTANDWSEVTYGPAGACKPQPDRDLDGVPDAVDGCPDDRNKPAPGLCGCFVLDTDTDHDGTPDCKDEAKNDPLQVKIGECGGAGHFARAGKPCYDAVLPGAFQCDGSGRCGNIEAARPRFAKGDIREIQLGNEIIFIVQTDKASWNDAQAAAPPGSHLLRIERQDDNIIMSRIAAALEPNATVWLDGFVTSRGVVSHSEHGGVTGSPLWDERAQPKNRDFAFTSWAKGQPDPNVTSGCVSMASDGTWSIGSCGALRSVIYERAADHLDVAPLGPITINDFPGAISGPNLPPGSEPCSDQDAIAQRCRTCIDEVLRKHPEDPAPAASCPDACPEYACQLCLGDGTDEAAPERCRPVCPEIGCDLCKDAHPGDDHACVGECGNRAAQGCQTAFGARCGVTPSDPPVPCERNVECSAPGSCTTVYSCPGGGTCGTFVSDKCSKECQATLPSTWNQACILACQGDFVCGAPSKDCAALSREPSRCSDELSCADPNAEGDPDPTGELLSSLAPATPSSSPLLYPPATPTVAKTIYPDAIDELAQKVPDPEKHAWCQYAMTDPADQHPHDDAAGTTSGQKAISFEIDPNLILDYHLHALPLGQIQFKLDAIAELSARAHFDIAGIKDDVSILDAQIGGHVDRCQYSGGAKIDLFGHDFLPTLVESFPALSALEPKATPQANIDACNAALGGYQEAFDRAKKAMRDAQELLRQYHAGLKNQQCFNPVEFCNQVLGTAPVGFPVVDCATATPEDVINLFILYYHSLVSSKVTLPKFSSVPTLPRGGPSLPDFRLKTPNFSALSPGTKLDFPGSLPNLHALPNLADSVAALSSYSIPKSAALAQDTREWMNDYGCGQNSATERQTLFQQPFQLGPIPMLLEVESVLKYGIDGSIDFDFEQDKLAALALGTSSSQETIASVTAQARPCVSAGLGLFVGAGFDAYGFRATAGVEGIVNLGTVSAPANASALVNASAEDENVRLTSPDDETPATIAADVSALKDANVTRVAVREIAQDLKGLWDEGELPIKQRRLHVNLGYRYGLATSINQVLAGHLKLALEIRFWRWHKRWSKYLVNFGQGIDLGEHTIFGKGGDVLDLNIPWATLQAPSPFVGLRYLEHLPDGVAMASGQTLLDHLPNLKIPVGKLSNLGWSVDQISGISLDRAQLMALGKRLGYGDLAGDLALKGVDLSNLHLSDLAKLGFSLDKFGSVPLTAEGLDALHLSASQLALLGIELPALATDRLDLSEVSLAHLGQLGLDPVRLDRVTIDWRDLPDLTYALDALNLTHDLRNSGANLMALHLSDFEKIGIHLAAFRTWPLEPDDVVALALTTSELIKLGVDTSGLGTQMDGDPSSLLQRGLDLSRLTVADLSKLGFTLADVAVPVAQEQLLDLSAALGYPDIQSALAAVGVTDLDHVSLAARAPLHVGLDQISELDLSSAQAALLTASDFVKLGYGSALSGIQGLAGSCTGLEVNKQFVGEFFYDSECTCRKNFDRAQPYEHGEQACSSDANCCDHAAGAQCVFSDVAGHNVCSSCSNGECDSMVLVEPIDNYSRVIASVGETAEAPVYHDFGRRVASVTAELLNPNGTGFFDDGGSIRNPLDNTLETVTILEKPGDLCGGKVAHPIPTYAIQGARVLDDPISGGPSRVPASQVGFYLRATDKCGSNVGWGNLKVRWTVKFDTSS